MSRSFYEFLVVGVSIFLTVISILSYHLYTNSKNREVYLECLRISERIATQEMNSSSRIFSASAPTCWKN
jgi:hypothetical protein